MSARDILFNKEALTILSTALKSSYPAFDTSLFLSQVFDSSWKDKALKERKHRVSAALNDVMNKPYEQAIDIILQANRKLPFNYFMRILPDFVETHGIDHLDVSMIALKELTTGSTSEFAVRPFIHRYKTDAMAYMYAWSKDTNEHVRRLSCEGCRPHLPWSTHLTEFVRSPQAILPILEQLKYDDSQYVQRSVGNCMNDISKHHPEIVLDMCTKWKNQNLQNIKGEEQGNRKQLQQCIEAITTRGCRTLLKKGNQQALELFGVGDQVSVNVENLTVKDRNVKIGGELQFEFDIVENSGASNGLLGGGLEDDDNSLDKLNGLRDNTKSVGQLVKKEKKSQTRKGIKEEVNCSQIQDNSINSDVHLLRVEYKIGYLKSNGTHSSKIFMLKNNIQLKQGSSSIKLKGSQKMQQMPSSKLYPGKHWVEITVNGVAKAKQEFMLI